MIYAEVKGNPSIFQLLPQAPPQIFWPHLGGHKAPPPCRLQNNSQATPFRENPLDLILAVLLPFPPTTHFCSRHTYQPPGPGPRPLPWQIRVE